MTAPLAILLYENLIPGTQVASRLQDLGYRVHTINDPQSLVEHCEREKPIVAVVDMSLNQWEVCAGIKSLKNNGATAHIPVVAFLDRNDGAFQEQAYTAGADLVANKASILLHLPQFLEHVLQVD